MSPMERQKKAKRKQMRFVVREARVDDVGKGLVRIHPQWMVDLKLAAGAVKMLGIKCGIVINRSDMGDDRVNKFAEDEGIPVLMEIPFDRKIAESYSRGELVVETIPEWRNKFTGLYNSIKRIVVSGGID